MKAKIILGLKIFLAMNLLGLCLALMVDTVNFVLGSPMPHEYVSFIVTCNVILVFLSVIIWLISIIFGIKPNIQL